MFVVSIIVMCILFLPGAIPTYFLFTFILGLLDKDVSLDEKVKKFSGFNLGKKLRDRFLRRK